MPFSTEIVFHNASRSESVESFVHDRLERLARLYRGITNCQVVIDAPHHHHQKGNHYRVRLALSVPGKDLVVGHGHKGNAAHEDLYAAIADAFTALESQMKTFVGKRRAMVVPHRRIDRMEAESRSIDPESEREPYGIEYEDHAEASCAGESAAG